MNISNDLTVRGLPLQIAYPGEVFWVSNSTVLGGNQRVGGSDTTGKGTYTKPWATIDFAIGQCTANRGDIIFVQPGHTETVSNATTILCDVAGVAIVGLGAGAARPTITFDTATTASIPISAANVTWKNVICSAAFADVLEPFPVTAVNCTLEDMVFEDAATSQNFIEIINTSTVDNEADGLAIINCSWVTPDTATQSWMNVDADLDSLVFTGNYSNLGVNGGIPSLANVINTKDLTNCRIIANAFIRLQTMGNLLISGLNTTTANTGIIRDNTLRHLDTAAEVLITTGTNIGFTNNKASAAVDASGFLVPAADS